jgi:hypothetical protein
MKHSKEKSMQSISRFQAITALAMGAFLGGQEAMAWCPTANNRTITCNNCTQTLTCDVYNIGAIVITGSNVIFDGGWYNLYNNSPLYSIFLEGNKSTTTIKNLYINRQSRSGSCIRAASSYNWDNLKLENVYANGGFYGLDHNQNGKVEITGGSFWDNAYGIYGYNGGSYGEGVRISGGSAWGNGTGVYLSQKPNSQITNGFSAYTNGKGAYLSSSANASIKDSYFDQNSNGTSGIGLELSSSNNFVMTGNSGHGNSGVDCKTTSSSGTRNSNSWGSYSGYCN